MSVAALADEILELPRADRLARLRREPDPTAALAAVCESVKQLALSDLARALEVSESARDLAEALGSPKGLSRALAARAHVLAYANRFEESLATAQRAEAVADEGGAGFEAAAALLASVQARARLGRLEDAAAAAAEAGDRFQGLGEPVWAAKARVNAGVLARMRDDPEAALAHFAAARPAFADQPGVRAQVESNAAEALLDLNRFAEAEAAFRRALAALQAADNRRAAAIVEGNLADLLNREGRCAEALGHFEHALRALEGESAPGDRARLEIERAEALGTIGLFDDARRAYERTLLALDNAGMAWESARARLGLGRTLLALGRPADAAAAVRDAAARFDDLRHPTGVLRSLAMLARVPPANRPTDLRSKVDAALPAAAGRAADTAEGLAALASILAEEGRPEAAGAALSRAIDLARAADLRPVLLDLLHARARVLASRAEHQAAADDLAAAMDLVDRLRGVLPADRFRAALQGSRAALYEDAVASALALGGEENIRAAFRAAERSRSRSLLELMERQIALAERAGDGGAGPEDPLLAALRTWRAELNALYGRLGLGARDAGAAARSWSARAAEAERRIGELESRLAATRPYAEAYRTPAGPDEVRAALAPNEGLVMYCSVRGTLLAFVVRREGPLRVLPLGPAAAPASLLDAWSLQLGRARARGLENADERLARAARSALAALYDALLRPLEPALEGVAAITVCPTGPLQAVPFHALWDGSSYVAEHRLVSRTFSASLLTVLPRPAATGRALVVGVPDAAAPGIAEEAAGVARALPSATALLDAAATARRVSEEARAAALIHVACHCTRTPGEPLSARLRLADRWLTVRDLYTLDLPGSVVVLTGCETAGGDAPAGDETFGLVRGFLGAGASAVVASLWPVHDAGAGVFVSRMYQAWRPGASMAAALASASQSLIRDGAHPALWAPFIHVGRSGEERGNMP